MNVLFVINGNEPYVSQQAQIELISGLQKKGVSILVIGNIFGEVEANFKSLQLPFLRVLPETRIDRN